MTTTETDTPTHHTHQPTTLYLTRMLTQIIHQNQIITQATHRLRTTKGRTTMATMEDRSMILAMTQPLVAIIPPTRTGADLIITCTLVRITLVTQILTPPRYLIGLPVTTRRVITIMVTRKVASISRNNVRGTTSNNSHPHTTIAPVPAMRLQTMRM
jgi:hypothetical protein